jgi:serine/threonine protein kinase
MTLSLVTRTIEVVPELTAELVDDPVPARADDPGARVGSVLGQKWRLDALLGVGGAGAVYAATHRNGSRVAIKVLHARHSSDESLARGVEQEACAANTVDHPGAVRILDDGRSDDGAIFLIMELLDGEGLHTRLARQSWKVSPGESLDISHGVLDVLAAAHDRGIVHCDIKPENVFITRRGEVKVLDFGIAGIFAAGPRSRRSNDGELFGTPGYMAPEQALGQGEEVDYRTDLWAVGAMLYRMLTGRLVHEAPSPVAQLVEAGTRSAPPFVTVWPEADPALAALMDRGLAFAKADRFADARQMQAAVRLCPRGGAWGTALRVPVLTVEPVPLRNDQRGPAPEVDNQPAAGSELTARIKRSAPARVSRRSFLMVAGGAAIAAVSAGHFGVSTPGKTAPAPAPVRPARAPSPPAVTPAEPARPAHGNIEWSPLAAEATPSAPAQAAQAGPPPRAVRRRRRRSRADGTADIWDSRR